MNEKKIIPCLDIKDGRVVKGVKFTDFRDVATPVERARLYNGAGADEIVFYDITASVEGRSLFTEMLREVRACVTVPLVAGGGIMTLEDCGRVFDAGADKVSINSGAIKNPEFIAEAARKFGSGRIVFALDVKRVSGAYHVFSSGGMADTGIDAIEWVRRGEALGAGELVVNSIDTDGVKGGFDLPLLREVCGAVKIPVVASGGAGSIGHFVELFREIPEIAAGLGASVFHFDEVRIPELKQALRDM
jgi:cyclase